LITSTRVITRSDWSEYDDSWKECLQSSDNDQCPAETYGLPGWKALGRTNKPDLYAYSLYMFLMSSMWFISD